MGNILIPFGGAGGKNRGNVAVLGDSTPFTKTGEIVSLPLPAGNYKKSVSNPRTNYGDGKNSELTISKGLLKQMAIDAFGIASITNFSAAMYAHKQVRLTWSRPTRGLWSGVHFIFKYGSMPTSIYDGFTFWDSADVHYETTRPLQEGLLYIRAYSYVETNSGRWYDYDGTPVYTTIQVTGISGAVSFGAGAGTWTVPEGVRRIRYILVGRGGDGGSGNYYVPGGGGGGGYFTTGYMDVSPGQGLPWVVPTGQGQGTSLNGVFAQGGRSPGNGMFSRGNNAHYGEGGDGGSGGAAYGGTPGTNGSDGVGVISSVSVGRRGDKETYYMVGIRPGYGQHSTTIGFNGVLYSGGGGAGTKSGNAPGTQGTNGLGNGGTGANHSSIGSGYNGGQGGTGCIYIAWGSSMNDGS